eukprot:8750043-Pyramimonas_sp.AAC.1
MACLGGSRPPPFNYELWSTRPPPSLGGLGSSCASALSGDQSLGEVRGASAACVSSRGAGGGTSSQMWCQSLGSL